MRTIGSAIVVCALISAYLGGVNSGARAILRAGDKMMWGHRHRIERAAEAPTTPPTVAQRSIEPTLPQTAPDPSAAQAAALVKNLFAPAARSAQPPSKLTKRLAKAWLQVVMPGLEMDQ